MRTVDSNGIAIETGDVLKYIGYETISCVDYNAEDDLHYGDTVIVDEVDDDGTFTAVDWVEGDSDFHFWFAGCDFEIVDWNPIDEELFTGEVNFF